MFSVQQNLSLSFIVITQVFCSDKPFLWIKFPVRSLNCLICSSGTKTNHCFSEIQLLLQEINFVPANSAYYSILPKTTHKYHFLSDANICLKVFPSIASFLILMFVHHCINWCYPKEPIAVINHNGFTTSLNRIRFLQHHNFLDQILLGTVFFKPVSFYLIPKEQS